MSDVGSCYQEREAEYRLAAISLGLSCLKELALSTFDRLLLVELSLSAAHNMFLRLRLPTQLSAFFRKSAHWVGKRTISLHPGLAKKQESGHMEIEQRLFQYRP